MADYQPMPQYVFFLGCELGVMIGSGRSPKGRLADLSRDCPVRVVLLGMECFYRKKDVDKRKGELHHQFRENRLHGEWFMASEELTLAIGS